MNPPPPSPLCHCPCFVQSLANKHQDGGKKVMKKGLYSESSFLFQQAFPFFSSITCTLSSSIVATCAVVIFNMYCLFAFKMYFRERGESCTPALSWSCYAGRQVNWIWQKGDASFSLSIIAQLNTTSYYSQAQQLIRGVCLVLVSLMKTDIYTMTCYVLGDTNTRALPSTSYALNFPRFLLLLSNCSGEMNSRYPHNNKMQESGSPFPLFPSLQMNQSLPGWVVG